MNQLLIIVVALTGLSLFGCGTTAKKIQARSQSEKTGVFMEVKDGDAISKGSIERQSGQISRRISKGITSSNQKNLYTASRSIHFS